MGDRVQSKFHDDANKRQFPPRPGKGSGQDGSQAGQDEQWAVLRHEVEDVDMRDRRGMQERAGWEQRDTDAERASRMITMVSRMSRLTPPISSLLELAAEE